MAHKYFCCTKCGFFFTPYDEISPCSNCRMTYNGATNMTCDFPYAFFKIIEKWCIDNYYTSFVVWIKIGNTIIAEILDCVNGEFEWLNDWWEGEEDVRMLGFQPIEYLTPHIGYPRKE